MSASPKSPLVERLPCKLSPSETALKASELANAVNKRDALTLEKGLSAQHYAKEIKEVERRIGDLAEEVRNGVEYRQIKVIERVNFERNTVEIIRTDTGDPCGQRAMRANERQAEMFPRPDNGGDERQLALGEAEELGPDDENDDGEDYGDDDDVINEESSELSEQH